MVDIARHRSRTISSHQTEDGIVKREHLPNLKLGKSAQSKGLRFGLAKVKVRIFVEIGCIHPFPMVQLSKQLLQDFFEIEIWP